MNSPVIQRIDPLTSLRFFAAFAIVVAHSGYYFPFIHNFNTAIHVELRQGVTFFFVLSGFILTVIYSGIDFTQRSSFFKFMRKRVARLWPLHITTLVINALLVPAGSMVTSLATLGILCMNVLMLQSIVPLKEFYLSFNKVSWSISTEFYFYLSLPLLLILARRSLWLPLLVVLPAACTLLTIGNLLNVPVGDPNNPSGVLTHLGLVYINPLVRIFDFAVGVVTGHVFLRSAQNCKLTYWQATALEVVSILLCVAILFVTPEIAAALSNSPFIGKGGELWLNRSGFSLVGFSFLILMFALQRGAISKFISAPHWVLLGDISYATYLCHMSILMFYSNALPGHQSLFDWLLCVSIMLLLSHVLYSFVEKPFRQLILGHGWHPPISLSLLFPKGAKVQIGSTANGGKTTARTLILAVECLCLIGFLVFVGQRESVITASKANELIASATAYRNKFSVESAGFTCDGVVFNSEKEKVTLFLRAAKSADFNQILNLELFDSTSKKIRGGSQRIAFMKAVAPGEVLMCKLNVRGLNRASKLALRVSEPSSSRYLGIDGENTDSDGTRVLIPINRVLTTKQSLPL